MNRCQKFKYEYKGRSLFLYILDFYPLRSKVLGITGGDNTFVLISVRCFVSGIVPRM